MDVFKSAEVENRSRFLNQDTMAMLHTMVSYIAMTGLHPVITETVTSKEEDEALNRVSSSHREGRAFDIRCKDWPTTTKINFQTFFEKSFGHLGAISKSDGKKRLVVRHGEGDNEHFHIQLAKSFVNQARLSEFRKYIETKKV